VHRNQAFELADELGVATGGEIQLDPPLQCSQAKLLEAPGLRLGELLEREIRERRAPPEVQRLAEPSCVVALQKPLELREVELLGRDANQVSGRPGDDPVRAERLAKLRDVVLDGVQRPARGVGAPELVDRPVRRDDVVRACEQQCQHGPLPLTAKGKRAVAVDRLQRPKDRELHLSARSAASQSSGGSSHGAIRHTTLKEER
jgi:hypothetical protein